MIKKVDYSMFSENEVNWENTVKPFLYDYITSWSKKFISERWFKSILNYEIEDLMAGVNKKLLNPNKKTKTLYYVFRDSDGAEIGANAYGDSNIQNFDKIIQLDGVYIISGYRVIFINQSLGFVI